MRLTTKGRYAVTAMIDIALHRAQGPVSVTEVAERQAISSAYLEQLFSKLKRAGLLQSVRGPGGGYEIARAPAGITVASIIAAVGEGVDATRCQGAADCRDGATCLTHDLWSALSQHIDTFLSGITLESLIAGGAPPTLEHRHALHLIEARLV
ncbi:MAG TPA: Fe-S cluster assembly transcriptional regulator IscR [Gammaproteobacteria bacterium]|jgi:Rrf2 family iron-sulfur cluster assembly transcriptional regulator|nr:Fe-S cluster assembly transcriptional regulator IscR [Gammaproteobacteria bacterium]